MQETQCLLLGNAHGCSGSNPDLGEEAAFGHEQIPNGLTGRGERGDEDRGVDG